MGDSTTAQWALDNLTAVLERCVAGRYELHVIDVLEYPEDAERDGIIAAPTVVKAAPPPPRRAIGDFVDAQGLTHALDLPAPPPSER